MADETRTFTQAAITFPLELAVTTGNTLLRDADPALWRALDFFVAVLRIHLDDRWVEAATAAGVDTSVAEDVVATSVPYNPADFLSAQQFKFPLFAVYRTREDMREQSVYREKAVGRWVVQWTLPPLSAAQSELLIPMQHAVVSVIRHHATWAQHPDYEDDLMVWDSVDVQGAAPLTATYGTMQGAEGLVFPTVMIELDVTERDMETAGAFDPIERIDTTVGVDDDDDGDVDVDVLEIHVEPEE